MSLGKLILECNRLWKNNSKSPEQIQAESLSAFRRMTEYAWNKTAFYPEFWGRCGINSRNLTSVSPEDFPVITKDDVRANPDKIAAFPLKKNKNGEWDPGRHAIPVHSSGSTGLPSAFFYAKSAITKTEANFLRLSNEAGNNMVRWTDLPIKNIHAASVGAGYASSTLLIGGLSKYHARCIILNASEPLDEWREKIGDFKPNFLSGYPSCIELLLGLQKTGSIDLHPLKIITGGEPLKANLMKELTEYFGADVIDFYGCTESLIIGAGGSSFDGLYLFDDMNYCETDDNGRLIITPLHNPAFPLIRYKMDDLTDGFTRSYGGPLPYTHIKRIIGRDADMLWFVNEKGIMDFLHPLSLDDLNVNGVRSYQFVRKDDCSFSIDCISDIPGQTVENEIRRQIDELLRSKHMKNLRYDIRFPGHLQRNERSGKIPLTIT